MGDEEEPKYVCLCPVPGDASWELADAPVDSWL